MPRCLRLCVRFKEMRAVMAILVLAKSSAAWARLTQENCFSLLLHHPLAEAHYNSRFLECRCNCHHPQASLSNDFLKLSEHCC